MSHLGQSRTKTGASAERLVSAVERTYTPEKPKYLLECQELAVKQTPWRARTGESSHNLTVFPVRH